MSLFDSWSRYITDIINSESALSKELIKHNYELGSAREFIIKNVLLRILPSIYEIGSGQIVDRNGKYSKQIDIIIARNDFPALLLPNGSKIYVIESVLATIEIKSLFNSQSIKEALENCYSIAELEVTIGKGSLDKSAQFLKLTKKDNKYYSKENPVQGMFHETLFRPAKYIWGFKGLGADFQVLKKCIEEYAIKLQGEKGTNGFGNKLHQYYLPTLFIGEKFFGCHNAPPYPIDNNLAFLFGEDDYPLRLLVMHLLFTLGRKVPFTEDFYGITPNFEHYLGNMKLPKYIEGAIEVKNL